MANGKVPSIASWFNSKRLVPTSDIGVDLGTANTLVCVRGEGVVLNEPSVVAVERETKRIMNVGLEAKRMLGRTPGGIEAVRPLRDGVIADVDVTELMLRHFLKQVMAKRIFRIKPRVVVGVPSGITELERRAVRSSAQAAGANEVYMVAEPMAAAIGVGLPIDTPRGNMVIDIGGGTTEIAVIALAGIVSDTSIRIGGDELDQSIVTFLRKNYNLLVGSPRRRRSRCRSIGDGYGERREIEVKGDLVFRNTEHDLILPRNQGGSRSRFDKSSRRCGPRLRSHAESPRHRRLRYLMTERA